MWRRVQCEQLLDTGQSLLRLRGNPIKLCSVPTRTELTSLTQKAICITYTWPAKLTGRITQVRIPVQRLSPLRLLMAGCLREVLPLPLVTERKQHLSQHRFMPRMGSPRHSAWTLLVASVNRFFVNENSPPSALSGGWGFSFKRIYSVIL